MNIELNAELNLSQFARDLRGCGRLDRHAAAIVAAGICGCEAAAKILNDVEADGLNTQSFRVTLARAAKAAFEADGGLTVYTVKHGKRKGWHAAEYRPRDSVKRGQSKLSRGELLALLANLTGQVGEPVSVIPTSKMLEGMAAVVAANIKPAKAKPKAKTKTKAKAKAKA